MKNNYTISMIESKKIDILKLLFIIMVVYVHSFNEQLVDTINSNIFNIEFFISNIASRCAVPGFFLISSVLLYKKDFNWIENLKKKFKTLMIPYLLLNAFWILFFLIVQKIPTVKEYFTNSNNLVSNWNILDYIDAFLGYKNSLPILYPLWFVRDLFLLNILSVFIKKIIDRFPLIIFIITTFVWLFIKNLNIFCLNVQAICFFIYGYYYVRNNIHFKTSKNSSVIIMISYIIVLLLDFIFYKSFIGTLIHRISMVIGIAFWYSVITKLLINNKGIMFFSKYTMGIYLFHEMLLTIVEKIAYKILPANSIYYLVEYLVAPLFVCGVCIVFCILFKRFFPKTYSIVTGYR